MGELTANLERQDVNKVYGCGNNHGFSGTFPIEWDATWTGKVYVNIKNVGSGSDETSPRKTVTVEKDTVPPSRTDNGLKKWRITRVSKECYYLCMKRR